MNIGLHRMCPQQKAIQMLRKNTMPVGEKLTSTNVKCLVSTQKGLPSALVEGVREGLTILV